MTKTALKQANFLLEEHLPAELKKNVSPIQQSKFVAEALKKELKRVKLESTFKTSFGSWRNEDHTELKQGVDAFVRKTRKSNRSIRFK